MLIRFVAKNIYSFGDEKEFSTVPNPRLKTLKHHLYNVNDFQVLKLCSIYGANGAGKSNLVKALSLLQDLVVEDDVTAFDVWKESFKFHQKVHENSILLAVEFMHNSRSFYYGVEILDNRINTEELYLSGLGEKDELIYERSTGDNGKTTLTFFQEFENNEKCALLKQILLEEFVKPGKTILRLLSNRENEALEKTRIAFSWFKDALQIIFPHMKPAALSERIDNDKPFKEYAEELMKSFDVGITSFTTIKEEFNKSMVNNSKEEYEDLVKKVESSPNKALFLINTGGGELILKKEGDTIWLKKLMCCHHGLCESPISFSLEEESDGTIRLLDFVPAFYDLVRTEKVYVIDEIERSIHPLLIRELIKKFSSDESTKGQLIFTTHESNLLDQEIFRQDEIWFSEKDQTGNTDLYSLNDFKEHKTIDIRKGYLSGRYGSIPFLGNLSELKWH